MESTDLYTGDYEPIGYITEITLLLENYQTDSDWDNWIAELGHLHTLGQGGKENEPI